MKKAILLFLVLIMFMSSMGQPLNIHEAQKNSNPITHVGIPNLVSDTNSFGDRDDEWWNGTYMWRIPIYFNASGYFRVDYTANMVINFTEKMQEVEPGNSWTFEDGSIRLIEYDSSGNIIGEIPYQFEKANDWDPTHNAVGTLYWTVDGYLAPNDARYYYVYFSVNDIYNHTAPSYADDFIPLTNYGIGAATTFYGYIFPTGTPRNVYVVGINDTTNVKFYVWNSTTEKYDLRNDTNINRMDVVIFSNLDQSIYYKVVADKQVVVAQYNGPYSTAYGTFFYPAVNGKMSGKEFIFYTFDDYSPYTVYFSKNAAHVTVYDSNNAILDSFDISAGHYVAKNYPLGYVYRVVSNTSIVIHKSGGNAYTQVPAIDGAAAGKEFCLTLSNWAHYAMYVIVALENANVTVYDLQNNDAVFATHQISAGSYVIKAPDANEILRIVSNATIMVYGTCGEGGTTINRLGDDFTNLLGIRAKEFWATLTTDTYSDVVVFAYYNDTVVSYNGNNEKLDAGQFWNIKLVDDIGKITADKPISILEKGKDGAYNDMVAYIAGMTPEPNITAATAQEYYRIQVHVTDADGNAFQGANVTLYKSGQKIRSLITDENGNCTFYNINQDTYTVKVWNSTVWLETSLIVRNQTSVDVNEPKEEVVLKLSLSRLTVHLTDLRNRNINEALIKLYNASDGSTIYGGVLTNSTGYYAFPLIPQGVYWLNVSYGGYSTEELPVYSINLTQSMVKEIQIPLLDLLIHVVSLDGDSVPSATVRLTHTTINKLIVKSTNDTGYLYLTQIRNGSWDIEVTYTNAYEQVIINSNNYILTQGYESLQITLNMTTMTVHVTDGDHDISSANITIYYYGESTKTASQTTNGTGYTIFKWVKGGNYTINVTGVGFDSSEDIYHVPQGTIEIQVVSSYAKADTIISLYNSTVITVYWNDTIYFKIAFQNLTKVGSDLISTNVLNTTGGTILDPNTIRYEIMNSSGYVIMSGSLTQIGDTCNWSLSFNIADLNLNASDTAYILKIYGNESIITNLGYNTPNDVSISIVVKRNPTMIETASTTANVMWGKNITIQFFYNDTRHLCGITGATVVAYWTEYNAIHASVTAIGNGFYQIMINSSYVPAGINDLYISVSRMNYESKSITITVNVTKAIAVLTLQQNRITVIYGTQLTINATYNCTQSGYTIKVNLPWAGVSDLTFTTLTIPNTYILPRNFTLTVWAQHENFTYSEQKFYLMVIPSTTIVLTSSPYGYYDHNLTLQIKVRNEFNGIYVANASLNMFYNWTAAGITNAAATLVGDHYEITLNLNQSPGDYDIVVWTSSSIYVNTSKTIQIHILNLPMEALTNNSTAVIVYWGDVISFYYSLNNTYDNFLIPFTEGAATLTLYEYASFNYNPLTQVPAKVMVNGTCMKITVDTKALKLNTTAVHYLLEVIFSIPMYQDTTAYIYIQVQKMPVVMQASNVEVTWGDNFTIRVNVSTAPLNGRTPWFVEEGSVLVTIGTHIYQATFLGNGTFVISLNSTIWNVGTQTVKLDYAATNYGTMATFLALTINPANMTIMVISEDTITLYYTQNFTISLVVRARGHNSTVDSMYLNIINQNLPVRYFVYNETSKTYIIILNSTIVPAGNYTLDLVAVKTNYVTAHYTIHLNVLKIPVSIEIMETRITAVYNKDHLKTIHVKVHDDLRDMYVTGATVYLMWEAGTIQYSSYESGWYLINFDPSATTLDVPGYFDLNIYGTKQNYTINSKVIKILLCAPTSLLTNDVEVELGSNFNITIQYMDTANSVLITNTTYPGALVHIWVQIGNQTYRVYHHNATHYWITLNSEIFGAIGSNYPVYVFASSPFYENHTTTDTAAVSHVSVIEQRINIPLVGAVPASTVISGTFSGGIIIILGLIVVAVKRMKIPYEIKQINKALSAIQKGKSADIGYTGSISEVIAELLRPGLEELGIELPEFEEATEDLFEIESEADIAEYYDEFGEPIEETPAPEEISEPEVKPESVEEAGKAESEKAEFKSEESETSESIPKLKPKVELESEDVEASAEDDEESSEEDEEEGL